jgi:glycosyltransferase involved in cell wall biosynthesis
MSDVIARHDVGVVIIGRNEGERLVQCLRSVTKDADLVVYVDSGSTDGSVALARSMGVNVVELDMQFPFTAARARNEGFRRLRGPGPEVNYVQFVDGDCEVADGWLHKAQLFLDNHTDIAVVCGRRRERYPERSVYNAMCDLEWDTPVGQAMSCGGDAMFRVGVFTSVQGYRDDLIAGEEPELCFRLRSRGWKVWRLDEEMTKHDAAIYTFRQWWIRAIRSGHAYAQGAALHGNSRERFRAREVRGVWFWALLIPAATLIAAPPLGLWAFVLLVVYPLQVARIAIRSTRSRGMRWKRAFFLVLGKFPELLGQLKFLRHHFMRKQTPLIEYK